MARRGASAAQVGTRISGEVGLVHRCGEDHPPPPFGCECGRCHRRQPRDVVVDHLPPPRAALAFTDVHRSKVRATSGQCRARCPLSCGTGASVGRGEGVVDVCGVGWVDGERRRQGAETVGREEKERPRVGLRAPGLYSRALKAHKSQGSDLRAM